MTMLSNLLSGLIGGIVGGLLSLLATFVGIRHERSRMRQDTSRIAVGAITKNMLAIREALDTAQWALDPASKSSVSAADLSLATIRTATRSVLYEYNVMVADKELRNRIDNYVNMVIEWYEKAEKSSPEVNKQGIDSIDVYTGCINDSIAAHLSGKPLPPDKARATS